MVSRATALSIPGHAVPRTVLLGPARLGRGRSGVMATCERVVPFSQHLGTTCSTLPVPNHNRTPTIPCNSPSPQPHRAISPPRRLSRRSGRASAQRILPVWLSTGHEVFLTPPAPAAPLRSYSRPESSRSAIAPVMLPRSSSSWTSRGSEGRWC